MKFRNLFILLGILALMPVLQSCTEVRAGHVREDLESWVGRVLTPRNTTLEKAETGYELKVSLKNRPRNLVIMWEMRDTQYMIDSVRSDAAGNFTFKGNLKEPVFAMIQWGQNANIYIFLENSTHATIEINADDGTYSIQQGGKGIKESDALRLLMGLYTTYMVKFNNLQNEMSRLPNTMEGFERAEQIRANYQTLVKQRNVEIEEYALKQKKSFIPYFVVRYMMEEGSSLNLLTHALKEAKAYSPNSKYTKEMQVRYDIESKLAIGAVAPDIRLPQPTGDTLSLKSLRGKVVLVDFWASWCGPCRKENPFNTKMYKRWKDKGFEIIGVSLDNNPGSWRNAIAADSLVWKHVSDLRGWQSHPAKNYMVSSIPSTFLLDKDGRIIAKGLRGEELEAKLREIFNKPEGSKG